MKYVNWSFEIRILISPCQRSKFGSLNQRKWTLQLEYNQQLVEWNQ